MPKMLLSDAIDQYLDAREAEGVAKNTLANNKCTLKRMLAVVGNIYVENIKVQHVTSTLKDLRRTRKDHAVNQAWSNMKTFFTWCVTDARCLTAGKHPLAGKKAPKFMKKDRDRLPVTDFSRAIDAAQNPRDRILIALAIYLLNRDAEIKTIRVGDVDFIAQRIKVTMTKTRKEKRKPMVAELERELRRWLTYYAEQCGELQDHWFLVPAYTRPKLAYRTDENGKRVRYCDRSAQRLNPERPIGRSTLVTGYIFETIGFETKDADGRSKREGMHTFRRSGSTALWDRVTAEVGADRAGDVVQEMGGWESRAMMHDYVGRHSREFARDQILLGQVMYPEAVDGENVRHLRAIGGEDG